MSELEDRILSHVERTEYLKEVARQEVSRLLSRADLADFLDEPEEFIQALLAAILSKLRDTSLEMTQEARDYATALGHRRLADEEEAAILDSADDDFLAFTLPILIAALIPVRDQVLRMMAAAPNATQDALSSPATMEALLASFTAIAKSSAAGYVQGLARTTIETSLQDEPLEWIAVMDGNTCDDDFSNSCAPRHGEINTLDGWQGFGLPGAPQLICSIYSRGGSNCRCQLAAVNVNQKLLNPVNVSEAIFAGRERAKVAYERR